MAWYVVQTIVKDELRAKEHLLRQEFDIFLPLFGKLVVHHGQRKIDLRALFPGYLFVRFNLENTQWRKINGTRGVRRLLCLGDVPTSVPDLVVEDLINKVDKFGVILEDAFGEWNSLMNRQLRITTGMFKDLTGKCIWSDGLRVKILLAILGRSVVVGLPQSQVRTVD